MKFPRFSFVPALVVLVSSFAFAQTTGQPERFTANAVSLSPEYGTGQQVVEFTVNRWSPEAERERLVSVLQQKGPEELLKQLQKLKLAKKDRLAALMVNYSGTS